jgi:hypothetical protein
MELIKNEDWKLALMAINPKSASEWMVLAGFFDGEHASRVLPIHHACALRPPKEIIIKLYDAYPQGFGCKESAFQRLPLHVACQNNAPLSAIQALLKYDHNNEAVQTKDSMRRLPLHYACSHGAPAQVVEALLQACPASAGCIDHHGWLPIHVACRFGDNEQVIRILIKALPESLYTTTKKGSTPLMCAKKVIDTRHKAVVQVLEDMMKDDHGGKASTSTIGKSIPKYSDPILLQHDGLRKRSGGVHAT